jgi:threonine/homoserine/homoserine lactone efflux protein
VIESKVRRHQAGNDPAMQDPLLFTLTVLAILGTPGPTNTLLATASALVGVRRSLPLILAELSGYLLAIAVLHAVFGSLLAQHPAIATVLRALVAVYLLAAAYEVWNRREVLGGPPSGIRFERVFVTTLLNPKAIVFAFGVMPLSAPNAVVYVLGFAGFVVVAALSWIALGALVGRAARPTSRAIPRASAIAVG